MSRLTDKKYDGGLIVMLWVTQSGLAGG
jgi:hypothetical protein